MAKKRVSFQSVLRWSDQACRDYLEGMRWPDGPACPKCGVTEPYRITRKTRTKNGLQSLYKCRACRKQFTATVGTIFEDSKIPLSKWFAAIFMMCSSKKGISAHWMHRNLDITYKSAWFMCHRIREAMKDKGVLTPLSGTVEADETYIHGRTRRGHKTWHERVTDEIEMGLRPKRQRRKPYQDYPTVFGILERGGRVRTVKVPATISSVLRPIMGRTIDMKNARLMTDGHSAYRLIKRDLPHDVIDHEVEYVRGDVHTQGIENYWSLLKRGIYGVFHHVGEGYLPQYLNEFEYRFNRRRVSDEQRFASLLTQTQGRVLWYCRTPQPQNPYA